MSILLILIYSSSWIAYKLTWRAASPVLNIARNLRKSGPDSFALEVSTKNLSGETKELAEALDEYAKRIDVFVERERQFTADVSHELRTPMTIIDGAAQFLETENNISNKGSERVKMIRRACSDVNDLTSAFFLMAREQNPELDNAKTNVAEIIENEVIKLNSLIDSNKVDLSIDHKDELIVNTHRKALEIIIGNILAFRKDGNLRVLNRGYNIKKQKWQDAEGKAKFIGPSDIGSLKVSFFGPFYGGYNIIELDKQNYQFVMIAGNDRSSMENSKPKPAESKVTMYHDGECPLCAFEVKTMQKLDRENAIHWVDITKDKQALTDSGISYQQAMARVHVRDENQRMQTGVRGFMTVWKHLPYYRRLVPVIEHTPFLLPTMEFFYSIFAKYRLPLTGKRRYR
ncbi:Outer membrane lipoprotein Blc [Nymphon striatum]|nr:Outer membrane lipoprotein Blc [Nymphon striatum]